MAVPARVSCRVLLPMQRGQLRAFRPATVTHNTISTHKIRFYNILSSKNARARDLIKGIFPP